MLDTWLLSKKDKVFRIACHTNNRRALKHLIRRAQYFRLSLHLRGNKGWDIRTIRYGAANNSALHLSAIQNTGAVIEYLLSPEINFDPNIKNDLGQTPLHLASFSGALGAIRVLQYGGCDFNSVSNSQLNALHFAAWGGHLDVFSFILLEAKGTTLSLTSRTSPEGYTCLHLAARSGHPSLVSFIASKLTTPNHLDAVDNYGSTALHHAAFEGFGDIVDILLRMGANPRVCDKKGRNAYDLAKDRATRDKLLHFTSMSLSPSYSASTLSTMHRLVPRYETVTSSLVSQQPMHVSSPVSSVQKQMSSTASTLREELPTNMDITIPPEPTKNVNRKNISSPPALNSIRPRIGRNISSSMNKSISNHSMSETYKNSDASIDVYDGPLRDLKKQLRLLRSSTRGASVESIQPQSSSDQIFSNQMTTAYHANDEFEAEGNIGGEGVEIGGGESVSEDAGDSAVREGVSMLDVEVDGNALNEKCVTNIGGDEKRNENMNMVYDKEMRENERHLMSLNDEREPNALRIVTGGACESSVASEEGSNSSSKNAPSSTISPVSSPSVESLVALLPPSFISNRSRRLSNAAQSTLVPSRSASAKHGGLVERQEHDQEREQGQVARQDEVHFNTSTKECLSPVSDFIQELTSGIS